MAERQERRRSRGKKRSVDIGEKKSQKEKGAWMRGEEVAEAIETARQRRRCRSCRLGHGGGVEVSVGEALLDAGP